MFKMKYLINRMWCNILPQQVGWFDGKGVCVHSKCQRIKPHKWCRVWSIMVCWPNIPLSKFQNRCLGWLCGLFKLTFQWQMWINHRLKIMKLTIILYVK
jgi:hypothetical protein